MNNSKITLRAFFDALGVLIYIFLVGSVMIHGEEIFGKVEGIVGMSLFLLLFVLSASVVGLLVFLKPIQLYLDGMKKEGVKLLISTVGFLLLFAVLIGGSILLFY